MIRTGLRRIDSPKIRIFHVARHNRRHLGNVEFRFIRIGIFQRIGKQRHLFVIRKRAGGRCVRETAIIVLYRSCRVRPMIQIGTMIQAIVDHPDMTLAALVREVQ